MQKINTILADAENILDTEIAPATGTDFTRIANALERIATALEKLSGNKADNQSLNQPVQENSRKPVAKVIPQKTPNLEKVSEQPAKPIKVQLAQVGIPKARQVEDKTPSVKPIPKNSVLENYLSQRGIVYRLKKIISQEHEKALDNLALYLGKNFSLCEGIYQNLKENMITPRNYITYSLLGSTTAKNTRLRAFCSLLVKAQILEDYINTDKPEHQLVLKPTDKELKYLSGSWLENYAKEEVKRITKSLYSGGENYKLEVLPNVEIVFQTGLKTELDVLFAIGREIFCIEAKTRPNLKALKISLNRINSLGFANHHLLFLSVNTNEETCQNFSKELGGVKIARLDNFEEALTAMIKAACDAPQNKIALG